MARKYEQADLTNTEQDAVDQLKKEEMKSNRTIVKSIGDKDSLTQAGIDMVKAIAEAYRVETDQIDIKITDRYIKLTDTSNPKPVYTEVTKKGVKTKELEVDNHGDVVKDIDEADIIYINYKDHNVSKYIQGLIKFGEYTNKMLKVEAENYFDNVSYEDFQTAYQGNPIPKIHLSDYENSTNGIYSRKRKQLGNKLITVSTGWMSNYWMLDAPILDENQHQISTLREEMRKKYGKKLQPEGTPEFNIQLQAVLRDRKNSDLYSSISDALDIQGFFMWVNDNYGSTKDKYGHTPWYYMTDAEKQNAYREYLGEGGAEVDYWDVDDSKRVQDTKLHIQSIADQYKHIPGRRPNTYKALQEVGQELSRRGNKFVKQLKQRESEYTKRVQNLLRDIDERLNKRRRKK